MGQVHAGVGKMPTGTKPGLRRAASAFLIAVMVVPLLSGWKVTGTKVRHAYYPVSGRNHTEIVRSVRRFAPMSGRAYGLGIIDFYPDYDMRSKDGACRITRADTGLSITLKLPEWKGPKDAPRSAARLGRHFERVIRQHELQHVKIAERYARKMSSDLKRLKPESNCWAVRRKAYDLIKSLKKQHIDAQRAFDRRTLKQIRRLL
ncbi:DUF922 domain-containing protein [Mesorhizobium sp. Z1-4]|uniref:DUF922 domain-containing protein n=1 Tax=Mesorhizobium sp. Z1-4 TaxID=2448478 RepID=UPI000FD99DD3|nr:DUF922 domain-containing protein [Mesorhizobium sp. Z1-4]